VEECTLSTTRPARSRGLSTPRLEILEDRLVPSGWQPTAYDQQFLERLNDARANPAAYGASIGLDLSSIAPSVPLAMDPRLVAAATGHSQDMSDRNYFGHIDPNGNGPGVRIGNTGFPWTTFGESIAAGYTTPEATLKALIIDQGEPDLGHRLQLLAMQPIYQIQTQAGVGIVLNGSGQYKNYYTIDTAVTADTRPFITGVIYNDANHSGHYDAGEGLPGVTISVAGYGTFADFDSGGFSIQVNPGGRYYLTISGGGLPAPITQSIYVSTINVRLNFEISSLLASASLANWVAEVGQDLLHRPFQPGEIAGCVNALQLGESKNALVASILQMPDYIQLSETRWVQDVTSPLLGRAPTQAELASWVNALNHGMTQAGLVFGVYNYAHSQQSDSDWVSNLTSELLGRSITSTELSSWVAYFKKGGTRPWAAYSLWNSTGYKAVDSSHWLEELSQDTIHRNLTSSEMSYWVNYLLNGGTRASVAAAFTQCSEFR
jgi:uncharacterized protein YkwD